MKCENCDRPLATKQDAKDIPPGEGEHLCWGACEPEDWRARALKAEQQVRELAEVAARNINDAQHLRRERDEALAEASRLDDEAIYQRGLYESARAEVERLRLDNADLLARLDAAAFAVQHGIREVAERQREACAERMRLAVDVNAEHLCRATPLVTEVDK